MANYATEKQREEIKRIGSIVFKGDIDSEAFLVFSPWLQKEFGYFDIRDILFSSAPFVIEKLKEMRNITAPHTPPTQGTILNKPIDMNSIIHKSAKLYLKGVSDGQKYPNKKPPPIEKIKAKIKEEMSTG